MTQLQKNMFTWVSGHRRKSWKTMGFSKPLISDLVVQFSLVSNFELGFVKWTLSHRKRLLSFCYVVWCILYEQFYLETTWCHLYCFRDFKNNEIAMLLKFNVVGPFANWFQVGVIWSSFSTNTAFVCYLTFIRQIHFRKIYRLINRVLLTSRKVLFALKTCNRHRITNPSS